MGRALVTGIAVCLAAAAPHGAGSDPPSSERTPADSRTVFGSDNPLLAAGATTIRAGSYEEGIRLTEQGLEISNPSRAARAAALSNLCAAYAATQQPDAAIEHCNESLAIGTRNWRAYSNRAYVYFLMGRYAEATLDLDAAASMAPNAKQVRDIRGLINEARFQPRVTMEDHP